MGRRRSVTFDLNDHPSGRRTYLDLDIPQLLFKMSFDLVLLREDPRMGHLLPTA